MEALTPAEREVLVLRDMEGWPLDQIAEARGSSISTVRTLLKRGRRKLRAPRKLRASLNAGGGGDGGGPRRTRP